MRTQKNWVAVFIFLNIVFCGLARNAFAGGFALYEGSVRANGLDGCLIGKADDPSAIFFNPAGITQLDGTQISLGGTIVTPMTHVRTESWSGRTQDSHLKRNYFMPPYAYVTYKQSERLWLGLGFFAPFGLGTEFDEGWAGRHNSYNAFVRVVTLNPNAAFKVTDRLSVSGGVNLSRLDLKLESRAPLFEADIAMKGNGMGVGYNLGVHYKLLDWIKLGLSYRSKIHINLNGRANYISSPNMQRLFLNGHIDSTVTLPDMLMLGVNFQALKNLSVELSTIRTGWSNFDQMSIQFHNPVAGMKRVTKAKNWNDVWRWQIGFEYNAAAWLDLRAGYVYDNGPTPRTTTDYLVPANDRQMFCFGTGFKWKAWTLDLSYSYLVSRNRTVTARPIDGVLKGKLYDGETHLYGLGIGYKF